MVDYRQALPLGFVLAGDYRVTGVLGQGGFGITYKADDLRLGAPVAIKEYFPSELAWRERGATVVARSPVEQGVLEWGRAKFLDEARTLARFRHPSIVRVSRLFEANNTAYMVLDFEMGPSLAEWRVALGREPSQSEADRIAAKLIDAVGAVHEAGILHRDIKPANVIMRDGKEPVLIDFGAARQALSAQSRTVHAIVTPGYSPKEQYAVDLDRQGSWSDIYALGATLYFLVTGRAPPDALSRDLGEEMRTAASVRGAWRPAFLEAIDGAMNVRAEDRPQSILEWRKMLLGEGTALLGEAPGTGAGAEASTVVDRSRKRRAAELGEARPLEFGEIPPSGSQEGVGRLRGFAIASIIIGAVSLTALAYWVAIGAPARDRAAWDRSVAENTVVAYDRYLSQQPSGRHATEARERRASLARSASAGSGIALTEATTSSSAKRDIPEPGTVLEKTPDLPASVPRAPRGAPAVAVPVQAPPPRDSGNATTSLHPPAGHSPSARIEAVFEARATLPAPLVDTEAARIAEAAPATRLRLSSGLFGTEKIAGFSEQPEDFASELARLSGKKLDLDHLKGDKATPPAELLQRLRSERDLLAWHSPLREATRSSEFAILAGAVPFGLDPVDQVRWMRADGARLLEQAYIDAATPLRVIPCGIAGGVGAWFKKEIKSPSGFRGLKVRGDHLIVRALRHLEAEVVSLRSDHELSGAFSGNRLDANFGVTPLTGIFLAQPRIASVYHYPGVHGPAHLFVLMMGAETWMAMHEAHRRLLDEACRRNLDRWAQLFPSSQNDVLNRIRSQRVIVRPFTGPVREALKKAADEAISDEAARSPTFRRVLESYNRYRR